MVYNSCCRCWAFSRRTLGISPLVSFVDGECKDLLESDRYNISSPFWSGSSHEQSFCVFRKVEDNYCWWSLIDFIAIDSLRHNRLKVSSASTSSISSSSLDFQHTVAVSNFVDLGVTPSKKHRIKGRHNWLKSIISINSVDFIQGTSGNWFI
jgi:hypothetical protein